MADGGLLYPCENHSGTIGSLVDHSIRELWTKDLERFPNASCIGCGKQRFRLHAFRRLDRQALFLWKKWRGTLDWSRTTEPIFSAAAPDGSGGPEGPHYTTGPEGPHYSHIRLRPVQDEDPCGLH